MERGDKGRTPLLREGTECPVRLARIGLFLKSSEKMGPVKSVFP